MMSADCCHYRLPRLSNKCANCLVFGWKLPALTTLQQCTRCKVLQYCSKSCQKEHWMLVHKSHCKKIAELRKDDASKVNIGIYTSHPFSVTKIPDDPFEAMFMVLERILTRMRSSTELFTDTRVNTQLVQLEEKVMENMGILWAHKKTMPMAMSFALAPGDAGVQIRMQMQTKGILPLKSQDVWSTLHLMWEMLFHTRLYMKLRSFKEPRKAVPKKFWNLVEDKMGPFPEYMAELVKAFYGDQFPSFTTLLKILCDGSLVHDCSICQKTMTVAAVNGLVLGLDPKKPVPTVNLYPHQSHIFCCGTPSCRQRTIAITDAWSKWSIGVSASYSRLCGMRCDCCFKLTEDVHRCGNCLAKNYCSRECMMKDWEEKHKDLCCKEERRIKGGAKTREETSKEGFEDSFRRMEHCGARMSMTGCNCGEKNCGEKVRNMCAEVEAVCKEKLSKGSKSGKKSNPEKKGKAKAKSKAD